MLKVVLHLFLLILYQSKAHVLDHHWSGKSHPSNAHRQKHYQLRGHHQGDRNWFAKPGDYKNKLTPRTQAIMERLELWDKYVVKDNVDPVPAETITWKQNTKERSAKYICQDYHAEDEDNKNDTNVIKVYIDEKLPIPQAFKTTGYMGMLHCGIVWFSEDNVAGFFFVIHDNERKIFQHRFKAGAIKKYLIKYAAYIGSTVGTLGGGIAGAAVAGASLIPSGGTSIVAIPAIGVFGKVFGEKVGAKVPGWIGNYLRYIG